jgi:maleate cis-trans isomerase
LLEPLKKFVTDFGFEVVNIVGLGLEPIEINRLGPEASYNFAKKADVNDADGIIIVATNFRTLEILKRLESELKKPVMSSNQALMWMARKMLKIPANEAAATPATANWPEVDQ